MGGGVNRYDGEQFISFTTDDGLAHNNVLCIAVDREGNLWFGTYGGGVSRYDAHRPDGEQFVTFTTDHGLGHNEVTAIVRDREGYLWFGTMGGGVSRYDGEQFVTFTTQDGLASDIVVFVLADWDGNVWFGTMEGVSRYDAHRPDGEQFVTFTTQDGLAHNQVTSILEDREGNFWFGTWGGGVSRYDGLVFQRLLKRDGLAHDGIQEIFQDRNGAIWIVTQQGITRYRSYHAPPRVRLTDVATDHRYGPIAEIRVPSSQKYLAFEFQGSSLKTPWDRMAYVYRLKGYDADWRPTRERRLEYADLPRGEYVFQVKAVDRDLAYSETPAEVRVRIHLPYGRIALIGLSAMAMMAAVVASGYAVKRRRERDRARQELLETQAQLVEEMGKELQVAHDLQMGLLPQANPHIPGFDIAGVCIPANRVGGDYFDYIWLDEMHTMLCIVLADVAGSAMKATIPVVMFSGMLHTASEHTSSPADLLNHLNRFLPPRLEPHSFITCCVAHVDVRSQRMVLCNAGQPRPLVRRGEHVHTISMETSHWPLGIISEVHYEDVVFDLQEGDVLLFHTDGAIEAQNEAGELYGFDRLEAALSRGRSPETDAEAWVEQILEEVRSFTGTASQHDDITLVVLKVGA
jgi:serine phosphatase RsbU (regulator of sigma subunit)/sugar lactone lactonase YvrE